MTPTHTAPGPEAAISEQAALRRVSEALALDEAELTATIVDRYVAEVDAYRAEEIAQGRDRMLTNVLVQLQSMRASIGLPSGQPFAVPQVALEVARARAKDAFPLEAVLQAYLIATQCVWEWMNHSERLRDDHQAIIDFGWPKWLTYVDRAMRVAANAYVQAAQERTRLDAGARRQFLGLLLAGQLDSQGLQHWLGVLGHAFSHEHVLVVLQWQDADHVSMLELSDRIAVRVIKRVTPHATNPDERPVSTVLEEHSALLIPGHAPASVVHEVLTEALAEDVPPGVDVVGAMSGIMTDLSEAHSLFGLLTQLVRVVVKDRTVACLENTTWLDHAIAAVRETFEWYRPKGTDDLARLLTHEDNLDWIPTLEAWFANSLNVRKAATALHVHPNTVYYRLAQIERLSGVNPKNAPELIDLIILSRLVRTNSGGLNG